MPLIESSDLETIVSSVVKVEENCYFMLIE